jgi:pyruvate/2-oxoglutarate dehydrogenase complex dihydrolipoamide acyltransferase (E2) component
MSTAWDCTLRKGNTMTTYRDRLTSGYYDGTEGGNEKPDVVVETTPITQTGETNETTSAAQAKADELGINLSTVTGTGKDGKVTVKDVENAANTE